MLHWWEKIEKTRKISSRFFFYMHSKFVYYMLQYIYYRKYFPVSHSDFVQQSKTWKLTHQEKSKIFLSCKTMLWMNDSWNWIKEFFLSYFFVVSSLRWGEKNFNEVKEGFFFRNIFHNTKVWILLEILTCHKSWEIFSETCHIHKYKRFYNANIHLIIFFSSFVTFISFLDYYWDYR